MRALPLLLVLGLAACASPSGAGAAPSADTATVVSGPDDDLLVVLDRGDGSPVQRWTLTCLDLAEGDHPSAQAACDHLRGIEDPFAPLPRDVACTQLYGGPQTATVTGRWHGRPVDLTLSRTDGCRIVQWDSLGPLLPG